MPYEVGDRIIVQTVFTNEAGVPTSPSVLTGEVLSPSGTLTPLTPSDLGSGVVRTTLPTFTEGGDWRWYVAGTAGVIAADQGLIRVTKKSDNVTAPDFLTTVYAAVCTVADGTVAEVDVTHTTQVGDRYESLTVTIRRDRTELTVPEP